MQDKIQNVIERINILAKKEKKGIMTPDEKLEQQELRITFLKSIKSDLEGQLKNIEIINEEPKK